MSRNKKFLESRNPIMKDSVYRNNTPDTLDAEFAQQVGARMTVQGAINKTFILSTIMLLTAVWSYGSPSSLFTYGGAIGGFIVVLIAVFKPHLSPTLAPVYAGLEGLFVGGISAMYAAAFNGIILQAVSLTVGVLFMMLFIYKSGLIKVTNRFRTGVIMATGAVFLVYILSFALSFFGIQLPYLHQGGAMGIGISLVIIGIASLNLLLDFDNFDKGEKYGAPKYMEWFSAMGLLITLVWLYIEILRLISIFSSD